MPVKMYAKVHACNIEQVSFVCMCVCIARDVTLHTVRSVHDRGESLMSEDGIFICKQHVRHASRPSVSNAEIVRRAPSKGWSRCGGSVRPGGRCIVYRCLSKVFECAMHENMLKCKLICTIF